MCVAVLVQVKVTTVDGPVELKIPAGTQPGTTLLMAKRGVPRLGASNQVRGNHNVSYSRVWTPPRAGSFSGMHVFSGDAST